MRTGTRHSPRETGLVHRVPRGGATSSPSVLPGGLLGSIGLIIVLECVGVVPETLRIRGSSDRVSSSWLAAGRAASGPEAGAEILCFGDSLIKLGILPRVLENRLGRSSHNLAVLGGQAPTSYFLLRRVLEQGHRPRALIIDFSPLLLAMDSRVNLDRWAKLPGGFERLELLWRARDPCWRHRWRSRLGSLRGRTGRRPIGPRAGERSGSRRASYHDLGRPTGFRAKLAVEPRGTGRSPAFRSHRGGPAETVSGKPMEMAAQSCACLLRRTFLEPGRRSSSSRYWVLTPAMSAWLERNDEVGTIDAYRQFVRNNVARFSGLIVLDVQGVDWDRSAFRDPIHLNRDGAVRLTLSVAESIVRCTDRSANGPRWLELDGNSDRSPNQFQDLLEDLDQSRRAVDH